MTEVKVIVFQTDANNQKVYTDRYGGKILNLGYDENTDPVYSRELVLSWLVMQETILQGISSNSMGVTTQIEPQDNSKLTPNSNETYTPEQNIVSNFESAIMHGYILDNIRKILGIRTTQMTPVSKSLPNFTTNVMTVKFNDNTTNMIYIDFVIDTYEIPSKPQILSLLKTIYPTDNGLQEGITTYKY